MAIFSYNGIFNESKKLMGIVPYFYFAKRGQFLHFTGSLRNLPPCDDMNFASPVILHITNVT